MQILLKGEETMEAKNKILTNKQMAEAFGGYNFVTADMKRVCQAQAKISISLGKQEGIRELLAYRSEPMMVYHDKYCEAKDVIILVIPQVKLKSWKL